MTPRIRSSDELIPEQLGKLWNGVRGQQNQTSYILDPTIFPASAGTPNCKVIIGDLSRDNFGNSTGLTGWGIASKRTGSWVSL